jgi:copper chaperone CopZ
MKTLLVLAVVACSEQREAKPVVKAPPQQLAHVTIKAIGMYCEETCPMKVRYALANNPAVYELGFDVSNESIFVSYDATLGPAKQVTKPMLVAIKQAGFDPWLAKEDWPADAKAQVVAR